MYFESDTVKSDYPVLLVYLISFTVFFSGDIKKDSEDEKNVSMRRFL